MSLLVFFFQKGYLCGVRLESVTLCDKEYCNTHICVVQFYRNWGTCELSHSLTLYSGGRHGVASARITSKQSGNILRVSKIFIILGVYRVIHNDGLNWTVNGAWTHARQLVAVFKVLCSLYGLTCVGYVQNSLEFVSRSPLIHVVGRSVRFYTDSLFAKTGDSNDKCSSSLEFECWNEDETHAAQQSLTQF